MSDDDAPPDLPAMFERMRGQLALLTLAVERCAAKQAEIELPDFAADLSRLIDSQERLADAITALGRHPALALTPERFADEVAKAGREARTADALIIDRMVTDQRAATASLDAIIGRARTQDRQRDALTLAGLAGVGATVALFVGFYYVF